MIRTPLLWNNEIKMITISKYNVQLTWLSMGMFSGTGLRTGPWVAMSHNSRSIMIGMIVRSIMIVISEGPDTILSMRRHYERHYDKIYCQWMYIAGINVIQWMSCRESLLISKVELKSRSVVNIWYCNPLEKTLTSPCWHARADTILSHGLLLVMRVGPIKFKGRPYAAWEDSWFQQPVVVQVGLEQSLESRDIKN